jgi:hypothetical protein
MLDAINHQGKFGEAYVRVLASAAGLVVYKDDIDHDGIDLCITLPHPVCSWSRSIEVRAKTTSSRPIARAVRPAQRAHSPAGTAGWS